jgi:hypothetical protein
MIKSKSIFIFAVICVIPVALYFGMDSITSLNFFPRGINSGKEYMGLYEKYGKPKVLISTKMKLIKRGVSVIPGNGSRININSLLGSYRKVPKTVRKNINRPSSQRTKGENSGNKDNNRNLVQQVEPDQGMIDKIFSGYMGYVSTLENELSSDVEESQITLPHNAKNSNYSGKANINKPNVEAMKQKAVAGDAKFYRADVYEANLLVCFKQDYIYRIVVLKEKFYKCSFPGKVEFYTYTVDNDFSVIYIPNGLPDSQFQEMLKMKKSHNKLLGFFEKWKPRRSRITFDKFYRLYKFTIPTSTTCMFLKNKNMIIYGDNMHKNETLLQIVEKIIDKNMLKM